MFQSRPSPKHSNSVNIVNEQTKEEQELVLSVNSQYTIQNPVLALNGRQKEKVSGRTIVDIIIFKTLKTESLESPFKYPIDKEGVINIQPNIDSIEQYKSYDLIYTLFVRLEFVVNENHMYTIWSVSFSRRKPRKAINDSTYVFSEYYIRHH